MAERILTESNDIYQKNTGGGLSVGELSRYRVVSRSEEGLITTGCQV